MLSRSTSPRQRLGHFHVEELPHFLVDDVGDHVGGHDLDHVGKEAAIEAEKAGIPPDLAEDRLKGDLLIINRLQTSSN